MSTNIQSVNMADKEQMMWNIFFRKMAEGKVPYQPKFYCIEDYVTDDEINQEGHGAEPTVQLIAPTQQQVKQAKEQLKRKLEEHQPKKRKIMCF